MTARGFSVAVALLALAALALPAAAADVAGARDHPLVGRYSGSEISFYKVSAFDEAALLSAPHDHVAVTANRVKETGGAEWLKVDGRVTQIRYDQARGRSSLEIIRNLEAGLQSKGFELLFRCGGEECFVGNMNAPYILGWVVDSAQQNFRYAGQARYVLAKLARPAGDVYASIIVGEAGDTASAFVKVVETKGMETGRVEFIDAGAMRSALGDAGRVALYGIFFDTGKDLVKPDSKPTLEEIAKLLRGQPGLKLVVTGHTDSQGGFESNVDLSRRRAAGVVAALVGQYGIARDRLTAFGVGMAAPSATNTSEDGRAKNRRVELVER